MCSALQDELVFGQRAGRPSGSGPGLRQPGQHPLPAGELCGSDQVPSPGEEDAQLSSNTPVPPQPRFLLSALLTLPDPRSFTSRLHSTEKSNLTSQITPSLSRTQTRLSDLCKACLNVVRGWLWWLFPTCRTAVILSLGTLACATRSHMLNLRPVVVGPGFCHKRVRGKQVVSTCYAWRDHLTRQHGARPHWERNNLSTPENKLKREILSVYRWDINTKCRLHQDCVEYGFYIQENCIWSCRKTGSYLVCLAQTFVSPKFFMQNSKRPVNVGVSSHFKDDLLLLGHSLDLKQRAEQIVENHQPCSWLSEWHLSDTTEMGEIGFSVRRRPGLTAGSLSSCFLSVLIVNRLFPWGEKPVSAPLSHYDSINVPCRGAGCFKREPEALIWPASSSAQLELGFEIQKFCQFHLLKFIERDHLYPVNLISLCCLPQRLSIAKEFGDKAAERRAYSNLGNALIFLGQFSSATEHYRWAKRGVWHLVEGSRSEAALAKIKTWLRD